MGNTCQSAPSEEQEVHVIPTRPHLLLVGKEEARTNARILANSGIYQRPRGKCGQNPGKFQGTQS